MATLMAGMRLVLIPLFAMVVVWYSDDEDGKVDDGDLILTVVIIVTDCRQCCGCSYNTSNLVRVLCSAERDSHSWSPGVHNE